MADQFSNDEDLELLRRRLQQKMMESQFREESPSSNLGLGLARGIDLVSRSSNANLDVPEILTGIKQPRSAGVTNAGAQFQAAENARNTKLRQAALDDVTSMSSIQKVIDSRRAREDKDRDFGLKERATADGEKRTQILAQKAPTGSSAVDKNKRTTESSLRKEYQNSDAVKDFNKVGVAYQTVRQAAQDPSPAGDLSLIFGYMKMLDPGSTVREGEFANAQNAAGVPDQIRNSWNRVVSGERLNPGQRGDFINQAKGLYDVRVKTKKQVDDRYRKLGDVYGGDAENILDPTDYSASSEDPQIANYAKQHGLQYSQAEGILRKRGYGK